MSTIVFYVPTIPGEAIVPIFFIVSSGVSPNIYLKWKKFIVYYFDFKKHINFISSGLVIKYEVLDNKKDYYMFITRLALLPLQKERGFIIHRWLNWVCLLFYFYLIFILTK